MSEENQKVAIITGAGSGIGFASAQYFAHRSYRVLLVDLDHSALLRCCEQIEHNGGICAAFTADVRHEQSAKDYCAQAFSQWGRIDTLVANAGVQTGGSLLESTDEDWQNIIDINLKGVAYACKTVLPFMCGQKSGSLVLVSSVNAISGAPGMAIYDASKAALLGLMRNLAIDYGKDQIRVNAICPGNTLTDFHLQRMAEKGINAEEIREMTAGYGLLGRIAEPDEIARAIYFLASEESSFVTGHTLIADGGFSLSN